jgi:hypothetical protein
MYTSGPPGPPGYAWPGVAAVARREFPGQSTVVGRADHQERSHRYLSDLVAPYGLAVPELAGGHSYGEMAAALLDELVPPDRPVDLLVLCFAIPDLWPGRATAIYLGEICPGRPLAFAICDQGSASAFTGLRLIRDYGHPRSVLLVLEQASLPYRPVHPADLPTGHTAVGLRLDRPGAVAVSGVHQYPGVPPHRAGELLAEELAGLDPATLIVDPGLAEALPVGAVPGPIRVAAPGRPHTGVWWALVDAVSGDRAHRRGAEAPDLAQAVGEPGRLVVASHDRQLGYLCLSAMDVSR